MRKFFILIFTLVLPLTFMTSCTDGGDLINEVEIVDDGFVINTLIMGLDKDERRTDTLLFFRYDSHTGKSFLMSIPRDTYVNINGKEKFISTVYAIGGAELTINKVKEITGLPVDHYVIFNFESFRNVIDALGGVEFNVRPEGYYYEDPHQDLVIDIPGGRQILDGKKAEGLVRYRADYTKGDLDRIEVQREFVKALIDQKFNADYIGHLPKIYNTLKDSVKSDIEIDELLSYANAFLETGLTELNSMSLPTTMHGAHLLPDEEGIKNALAPYLE